METEMNFDCPEDIDTFFHDEGVIEYLVDYYEEAGKHDCTTCHGYYQDREDNWWRVSFSCSYNNGVESIWVDGPYIQDKVITTVNKYRKKNGA